MCMFHEGKDQIPPSGKKRVYLSILSSYSTHYKLYLSLAPREFMKERAIALLQRGFLHFGHINCVLLHLILFMDGKYD